MNYYIQGNKEKAKEIKAAFEAKGINTASRNCSTDEYLYYTCNGLLYLEEFYDALLNVFKSNPHYKELELTVKPMFKVGNWITDGTCKVKITAIDDTYYWYSKSCIIGEIESIDKKYHLWTIADAKDGDVLANTYCPFIYRKTSYNDDLAYYYAGIDYTGNFTHNEPLYHFGSVKNVVPATSEESDLLFAKMKEAGYTWDEKKRELKKITIKPKFKVGNWIVGNEGVFKITQYEDEHGYDLTAPTGCVVHFVSPDYVESNFHLWTIEDAKDGDVLAADECYVIFKEIDGLNIKCYCTYHYIGFNPIFYIDTLQNKTAFRPATQEQCDWFFKKMQEAGYQWDSEKKELEKIKSHYNIENFHAGMPVLVRDMDGEQWTYTTYSHYDSSRGYKFMTSACQLFVQCIPFNEKTKYLLGTTNMCPEEYINW